MSSLRGTALVLIDLQNAFFENGPLAERRPELVARAQALLDWAHHHDLLAVNIRTVHRADRSTWTLNMLEDDQGFALIGDHQAQPLGDLDLGSTVEIVKTRDDAFLGTDLAALLSAHAVSTVALAGVSTQSCVATTAAHAYAADLHVVLAADAIASERPELHDHVLALLRDEYRFTVAATARIVAAGGPDDPEGDVLGRGA